MRAWTIVPMVFALASCEVRHDPSHFVGAGESESTGGEHGGGGHGGTATGPARPQATQLALGTLRIDVSPLPTTEPPDIHQRARVSPRDAVRATLDEEGGMLTTCSRAFALAVPNATGRVMVSMHIGPNSRIDSAEATAVEHPNLQPVVPCITGVMRSLHLPPTTAQATVEVPFVLGQDSGPSAEWSHQTAAHAGPPPIILDPWPLPLDLEETAPPSDTETPAGQHPPAALTQANAQQAIGAEAPTYRICVDALRAAAVNSTDASAAQAGAGVRGQASVRLEINPAGTVTGSFVPSADGALQGANECLAAVGKRMHFTAAQRPTVITYTLDFEPEGSGT